MCSRLASVHWWWEMSLTGIPLKWVTLENPSSGVVLNDDEWFCWCYSPPTLSICKVAVVYTALDSTYGDMMKSRGCSWGIGVVWLGHSQRYKMIIIARACCRRNHLQVRIWDIQCTVDEYKWQTFYCLQPTSGGLFHLLMRAIQSACLSVC